MKLNEISETKQISEGVLGSIVKSVGSSMTGNSMRASQYQVKDKFIKNFATQMQNELNSAIASGELSGTNQQVSPAQPNAATPGAPTGQTPAQIRQAKQKAAAAAAQAQMNPGSAAPKAVAPQPVMNRQARRKAARASAKVRPARVSESYDKLNQIFEGIMNLSEQPIQSVTDFVTKKTAEYLGPDAQQYSSQIRTLAASVDQAYKARGLGNIAAPLTKLGNLVYTIASSKVPRAQQSAGASYAQPSAAVSQVTNVLPKLNKNDLMQVKKNIDSLLTTNQ